MLNNFIRRIMLAVWAGRVTVTLKKRLSSSV
jgi:hypothetical protein